VVGLGVYEVGDLFDVIGYWFVVCDDEDLVFDCVGLIE